MFRVWLTGYMYGKWHENIKKWLKNNFNKTFFLTTRYTRFNCLKDMFLSCTMQEIC